MCALLGMLTATLEHMRPAEVATVCDAVSASLLRTLDLRCQADLAWTRCAWRLAVEPGYSLAVQAVSLTLADSLPHLQCRV